MRVDRGRWYASAGVIGRWRLEGLVNGLHVCELKDREPYDVLLVVTVLAVISGKLILFWFVT